MAELLGLVQLERLRNGDEAVFRIVYEHFKAPIYNFCGRYVLNEEDAKDMASETFFKLWNARADIKNSNHLPRLLYTIARNTCIDFLRTSGRRAPGSHIIEKYASEIFESESDPSWILIQAETLRDFHELINRTIKEIQDMPNEYGKILRLFAIEQKKPVEIANMLGIRINTVKTHLVTARKQLRQRLEELGLPPDFIEKSTFSYFISQLHRNNI